MIESQLKFSTYTKQVSSNAYIQLKWTKKHQQQDAFHI